MYKDTFSIVERVHHILADVVSSGDVVIDATAGRGNDTLFLARLVGENGKVWAFDIQEEACLVTKEKLAQSCIGWVAVICDDHANMARYVQTPIRAGVFNLGYLPGANHQVVTKGDATLAAMQAMMKLLVPGGVVILVCYLGHEGGREEYEVICNALQAVSAKEWCVEEFCFINKRLAPRIITITRGQEKLDKGDS